MADEMGAAKVAEKLRAIVCSRRIPPLAALCTVSAGVASSSTMPAVDLLAAADRALYQAKCSGRNRVALASSFDA
jgi:PleD family two-component response regulator